MKGFVGSVQNLRPTKCLYLLNKHFSSKDTIMQRMITSTGSIALWLTSCCTCLVSATLLMFNVNRIRYVFGWIQSFQTGGEQYSDTSLASEYSLDNDVTFVKHRPYTENTNHRGKYHSTAHLLFDWFGFDQTRKYVVHST